MISIDRSQRKITGKDFLDEKFNEYEKIKSRSRPEEPSDLVYDILSDMEELFLYKRGNSSLRGWVNKIELPPPLHSKVSKSLGVSYDRLRNPEKYALREQSRTLENNVKITQKSIDQQWIDKKERELSNHKKENSIKINESSPAITPSHIEREHDEFLYDKHHRHMTLKNRLTNMFIAKNNDNIKLEEDEDIVNEPNNNNLELKIDIDDDEKERNELIMKQILHEREEELIKQADIKRQTELLKIQEDAYHPDIEKIIEYINRYQEVYNRKPLKDEIMDHLKDNVNNDVLDKFIKGYMY